MVLKWGLVVVTNENAAALPDSKSGEELLREAKQKWLKIQQRLRAELGDDLFTSWFGRMDMEGLFNGQCVVSVPTRFLKSWIENHYISRLHKIAESELGSLNGVVVRVRSQGQAVGQSQPIVQRSVVQATQIVSANGFFEATATAASHASDAGKSLTGVPLDAPDKSYALDASHNFETFMVGQSNQLAHAAAARVASALPGSQLTFNPLYIHSPAGLGKSHLLNAINQRVRQTQSNRRVMMLTAERFMYGFIHALRQRDTLAFKDQFQSVDVLLIDDFQFLQGKSIQQEFCHAFNSLVDSKRQVVIAADVPPAQLDAIDQRMRSRMLGGLVIDIETPDEELRRKIVNARHDQMVSRDPTYFVPADVLDLVASRITGGGRELEGALNRIAAYQQFNKQTITLDLASMVLRDASAQGNQDPGRIKIDDILKIVGRHYNVAKADLLSPRRARTVVVPRQIGMYLAKKLTSRSLPEIGRRFGGRDHSTVLHAVRKIDEQIKVDEKMAKDVALLIRLVEQN